MQGAEWLLGVVIDMAAGCLHNLVQKVTQRNSFVGNSFICKRVLSVWR